MILHGGRLSPFVRRVDLWLAVQQRPVERRYVSAFDPDFGGLLAVNPLGRVPVLSTDAGDNLFETAAIIDFLEDSAEPARRLIPVTGAQRRHVLQGIALAHGIAEKAVAYAYETHIRPEPYQWKHWQDRLITQVKNGLAALDIPILDLETDFGALGIVGVCAYDFVTVRIPEALDPDFPNLSALSERANAHPAFASTYPRLS